MEQLISCEYFIVVRLCFSLLRKGIKVAGHVPTQPNPHPNPKSNPGEGGTEPATVQGRKGTWN